MEQLINDIVSDLTIELEPTDPRFNAAVLEAKVRNAIREVRMRRNYPSTYTKEQITTDLENYYPTILNLARYDYNQIGAEGQTEHSESSVTRRWADREKLFHGVFAFVTVLNK